MRKDAADSLWFGHGLATNKAGELATPEVSWRSCLQLILAGDFLSPSAVPLLGSDVLQVSLQGDRAATLERAWEARYAEIVGRPTLAEPMAALRQSVLGNETSNRWLPLLLLNGTSVATGRRIITTDGDFADGRSGFGFTDADDLHDMFRRDKDGRYSIMGGKAGCKTCDVRLSTAATMSARFPIVSPHGTIRGTDDAVIDRVVDGGYFEDNGAITAQELTDFIWNRARLAVSVILVTNDTGSTPLNDCSRVDARVTIPPQQEATTLSILSSPARAFLGTRTARGTLASLALCKVVTSNGRGNGEFIHFGVEPERDVFGKRTCR